jgi:arylsulfatase A-like enzyme
MKKSPWRLLFILLAVCTGPINKIRAQKRPNIIFMMTDNQGFGDVGCYGGGILRGAPTPNMDKIAARGLQLLNYNVEPECTPTRSAIMTRRMPIRSGTSKVPYPGLPQGITPWEYTVAKLLSDAGYETACYGKWDLADMEGRFPTDQGFDEWFGSPTAVLNRFGTGSLTI